MCGKISFTLGEFFCFVFGTLENHEAGFSTCSTIADIRTGVSMLKYYIIYPFRPGKPVWSNPDDHNTVSPKSKILFDKAFWTPWCIIADFCEYENVNDGECRMAASETRIELLNVVARRRKIYQPFKENYKHVSVQCCPKEGCFWKGFQAVLVRETCSWKWVWTDSGIILTGETRSSRRKKPVPLSAFPPQISRGLTWDRTQASAVRGRSLKTKAGWKSIIFT